MASDLSSALGDLLPAALGVAISPIPIIATVLMLLSKRATVTAPAFAVGWVLGITVVLLVVLLIAGPDGVDTSSSSDLGYWIKLALGAVFLLLAIRTWRSRPRPGQPHDAPKWMASLDDTSPLLALGSRSRAVLGQPQEPRSGRHRRRRHRVEPPVHPADRRLRGHLRRGRQPPGRRTGHRLPGRR
jgi:hypothetical protein